MNATKNIVLGVMGKVGSGKTSLIKIIEEKYKIKTFIADDVFKEMKENGEFDEDIDLNSRLFLDTKLQERIRKEYHPKVFNNIKKEIEILKDNGKEYDFIVIETALPSDLFLSICDKTIYIENDEKVKQMRLMNDRNYSISKIKNILESQEYYEKFYKKADYKIINNNDIINLKVEVGFILDEIHSTK